MTGVQTCALPIYTANTLVYNSKINIEGADELVKGYLKETSPSNDKESQK